MVSQTMAPESIPETCAIAFKEWAGVCAALASGRQSVIVRKGGIAEGPGGFLPEHPAFWLYPTFVHEAEQGLKSGLSLPRLADELTIAIDTLIVVESVSRVDDMETLDGLTNLHVWTGETIRKRFNYRKPGLWVLGVRAYRRPESWIVSVTPAQLGCKSWVTLESALSTSGLVPTRTDTESAEDRDRLATALRARGSGS